MPKHIRNRAARPSTVGAVCIVAATGVSEASVTIDSVYREVQASTGTSPTPMFDFESSASTGGLTMTAEATGLHEPWGGFPLTNRVVSTSIADASGIRGTAAIDFHAYAGPSPSIPGGVGMQHEMFFTVDTPTPFLLSIEVTGNLEELFAQGMPVGAALLGSDESLVADVLPLSWGGPLNASGTLAPGTYRAVYGFEAFAGGDTGTGGRFAGNVHFNITIPTPGAAVMLGLGGLLAARRRR